MKQSFHSLLRWLIFLWVKVEVFPRELSSADIDPLIPAIYVIADRGLSDLLVLSQITRNLGLPDPVNNIPRTELSAYSSVYRIASRSPLIDWLRRRKNQPLLLQDLLEILRQDKNFAVKIIPVSVYWGRPLEKHKNWMQVLFADTWAIGGRIRKFFRIIIHGRNTRLIFSQALEFNKIARECSYSADQLHEYLLNSLSQQHEATFGPQITSHKVLTTEVLESDLVRQAVANKSADQTAKIKRYCREIFANCTQITIEVMLRLLRLFWSRYYSGIDIYHIDRIKQVALTHQLVYVPCHRSHVDYLLLSYIIFTENLAIPYIAAGNNLNMPVIGRILRGGGAFFIRRSFKDNPVYSAVMQAYVARLIDMGVPMEYFIEGGRSRTGRMLKPKLGMLKMTVDAYIKSQSRPLAFVPVYIGYEKLLEGKSYLGELYGNKKKKESLPALLGSIFKLKGHFGRVTASFGKPIILSEFLDGRKPDWQQSIDDSAPTPDWYRATINSLASQIMFNINSATVVNPVNLIATIVLSTPRQSIDSNELVEQSALYVRLIQSNPVLSEITVADSVDEAQISRIASQKLLHVEPHPLGDIVYLKSDEAVLMSYYRNNSLHVFIIPALIACCFVNTRQLTTPRLMKLVRFIFPFLKSELQLEWQEQELQDIVDHAISSMIDEKLLYETKTGIRRPDRSDNQFIRLIRLAHIIQPILERYYMTFIVLWQSEKAPMKLAELEQRCYLLAQKISMIYGINSPDFYDRLLFHDFIKTMLRLGLLDKNEHGGLIFTDALDLIDLDIRNLLGSEVRSTILSIISKQSS